MTTAIILAAGKSERMGAGTDKAFLSLVNKPVLAWSLMAFEKCVDVDRIVLVGGWRNRWGAGKHDFTPGKKGRQGRKTRRLN